MDLFEKLAEEMGRTEDWYLYRQPINNPTKYKGKGRPKKTDYAIYKTLNGDKRRELNF